MRAFGRAFFWVQDLAARNRVWRARATAGGRTILCMGLSRNKSEMGLAEPATTSTTGVYSFYLAGQWLTSPQIAEVTSPFDQRVVGRVSMALPEHLEQAIEAAVKTFAVTRKLAAFERQKALAKIAAEMTVRAEEFAQCISAEAGKPLRTARGE